MFEKICLIGEVIIDVSFLHSQEKKMRLGGIIHAARALWAIDAPYDLLYIAPQYLHDQIENYAKDFGAEKVKCIGKVNGAPNVVLINDVREIGAQGYELLLRDEQNVVIDPIQLKDYTDKLDEAISFLLIPGKNGLEEILNILSRTTNSVHIDIANVVESEEDLELLKGKVDTIITSTSSSLFLNNFKGNVESYKEAILSSYCSQLLFKENRGGSRYFHIEHGEEKVISISAQIRKIAHSVGVGDCFNAVYLSSQNYYGLEAALNYASWVAAEYASTTYPQVFKNAAERTLKIKPETLLQLKGVSLPWENRENVNIYIAAPDFNFRDRSQIDYVAESLTYHNFKPRLPIRENGQMEANAPMVRRQELYEKDILLLRDCNILLAVLLDSDPGTLVEIGLGKGMGLPVLVYDPFHSAQNCMLTQLPDLLSTDFDEIMLKIFEIAASL